MPALALGCVIILAVSGIMEVLLCVMANSLLFLESSHLLFHFCWEFLFHSQIPQHPQIPTVLLTVLLLTERQAVPVERACLDGVSAVETRC